jgi:NAD(P)-dependent dehydrogenase (short-subunit alcohol dehydrogenase family)
MQALDHDQAVQPRRRGLSPEELSNVETVYRPDLLRGHNFLVSGGGSGMGRATAFLITRLGGQVTICGRNEGKLAAAASDIKRLLGREIHYKAMTIRDPAQVESLMAETFERYGSLDALVNSAGGQFPQQAIDFSVKGWNAVVDTNLNGTWWMMQAAARQWRDRNQPGSIVNIVTTFDRGTPQSAHTAAARAGVVYLSKSVAVEWAPLHIRVNCIAPGNTVTEGLDQYPDEYVERFAGGNPMQRAGDTLDLAQAVVYLSAASGKWITGAVLHVNGGMHLWGTNWPLGMPDHFKSRKGDAS